ncbi:MAG: hypothetical protein SWH68_17120 [Thermodesulfobacteriota bacterium]|nr:hypothetical protein [Thermodesulfobacteriota bacterium]
MEGKRLSLDSFISQIEETFGKKLTVPASEAAEDFWNYWEEFTEFISNRQLSATVDPLFLAHNFPQYRRYHTWKGAGIVLILVCLGIIWFWWYIGIILLLIGFGLRSYGNRVRFNDAKDFAEEIMKEATLSAASTGYARLCANYIAGIVELATPQASAHWPQHPSNKDKE